MEISDPLFVRRPRGQRLFFNWILFFLLCSIVSCQAQPEAPPQALNDKNEVCFEEIGSGANLNDSLSQPSLKYLEEVGTAPASLKSFEGKRGSSLRKSPDFLKGEKKCVQVDVVYKSDDLAKGLKFREKLATDSGMLFLFSRPAVYRFWMKDTKIPLDMIWMDYARRVVHVRENVPPCEEDPCPSYSPEIQAMYVLEVNAGHAMEMGIKIGDTAEFRIGNL